MKKRTQTASTTLRNVILMMAAAAASAVGVASCSSADARVNATCDQMFDLGGFTVEGALVKFVDEHAVAMPRSSITEAAAIYIQEANVLRGVAQPQLAPDGPLARHETLRICYIPSGLTEINGVPV